MKSITVNVTQRDIDQARTARDREVLAFEPAWGCPLARAFHRHPGFRNALVEDRWEDGERKASVVKRAWMPDIELPDIAAQAVDNFDWVRPVKPFTFTIEYDE